MRSLTESSSLAAAGAGLFCVAAALAGWVLQRKKKRLHSRAVARILVAVLFKSEVFFVIGVEEPFVNFSIKADGISMRRA